MGRDERYVIDMLDQILERRATRQHRFDFLRGDSGKDGRCRTLPLDGYCEDLGLVVEYWERQHLYRTPIMDDKPTCSGCCRGEQRRIYDERKRDILQANGIALVVVRYDELAHKNNGRLRRQVETDEARLRKRLASFLP